MDVERWEGGQAYVGGTVWNNFLDRQSHLGLKPKVAGETTATEGGSSSNGVRVAVLTAVLLVAGPAVWIVVLRRGRALEE